MIKIGSRKSPLAMRQTEMAVGALKTAFPNEEFKIVGISTEGDKKIDTPLKDFGGKGAFIKELETALLRNEIQMAVHSAKDMPTELPEGLIIAAALKRGAHRDVLVCRADTAEIRVIGTGSARRAAQLRLTHPNAEIRPIRGNIGTRIEKLKNGGYDAITLAEAAVERLGIDDRDIKILPLDFICAACQGIIAVETASEGSARCFAEAINHADTFTAMTAEREFLRATGGGCHSAAGAYAEVKDGIITMETFREIDGNIIRKKDSGTNPIKLAQKLAREE